MRLGVSSCALSLHLLSRDVFAHLRALQPWHVLTPSFHPQPHLPFVHLFTWCLHTDLLRDDEDDEDGAPAIPAVVCMREDDEDGANGAPALPAVVCMREVSGGEVWGLTADLEPTLTSVCTCVCTPIMHVLAPPSSTSPA